MPPVEDVSGDNDVPPVEDFSGDNDEPTVEDLSGDNDDPFRSASREEDNVEPIRKKLRFEDKENEPPINFSGSKGSMSLTLSSQAPLATIWKPAALAQSAMSGTPSPIPPGLAELVFNQQQIEAQRNRQILEAMRASTSGDLVAKLLEFASKK